MPLAGEGRERPPSTRGDGRRPRLRRGLGGPSRTRIRPRPGRPVTRRRLAGSAAEAGRHPLGQRGRDRPVPRRPPPPQQRRAEPVPHGTLRGREAATDRIPQPAAPPRAQTTGKPKPPYTYHRRQPPPLPHTPPPPASRAVLSCPFKSPCPARPPGAERRPASATLPAPRKREPAPPVGRGAVRHTQHGGKKRTSSPPPQKQGGENPGLDVGRRLQPVYTQHGATRELVRMRRRAGLLGGVCVRLLCGQGLLRVATLASGVVQK